MRLHYFKKAISIFLAIIIAFALASCHKPEEAVTDTSKTGTDSVLFSTPTDLSILIGSHPSWPYNENLVFWKYMREETGANLKITSIPNSEFNTKLALLMATPKDLPDLVHMQNKPSVESYASQGAFVAIDDYLDEMPNYSSFWNSMPEETRNEFLVQRLSADGKTYFPQVYGNERVMNLQVWMYRKDIFEKNNLTVPQTLDDMYNVGLKLKEIYPDSYPICMRTGLSKIGSIGPQFKPCFGLMLYYDFPNKKWCYGAAEPTMLEIVKYLNKLRDAELVPPDYLTINTKSWEEIVSTDRGFIMPEFMVRIDFFNIPNRERDPNYTWAVMAPPRANNGTGQNLVAKLSVDPTGYVICNTGDKNRIQNAVKFLDWMYSDKASELLSWGVEGETYNIADGKRKFIVEDGENPKSKYGLHSYGLYQRLDPDAVIVSYSDEQAGMMDFAIEHLEPNINPANWLALAPEEVEEAMELQETLLTLIEEKLSKFLLNQEPISSWDAFQNDLRDMGVERLIQIYEEAYDRVIK